MAFEKLQDAKPISVRMKPAIYKWLKLHAVKQDKSVAVIIDQAVREYMAKQGETPPPEVK